MKTSTTLVLPLLLAAIAPSAGAQSISKAWDAYRNQSAQTQPEQGAGVATQTTDAPAAATAPAAAAQGHVPPPASYSRPASEPKGGFFVGAQAGKGWVYEDVDQNAVFANAGYRWQAGAVSLIGIELGSGRLGATDKDGYAYEAVRFGSIGATARFNFGENNPWFAIARLGVLAAEFEDVGDSEVSGSYASFGIGVDVNRHFNVSLVYTGYAYSSVYYDYEDYLENLDRADSLMFGIEGRF